METTDQDRIAVVAAAHLALEQWSVLLGTAGRAAMRTVPGLLATVDQHAAEIRAALADCFGRLSPVTLAAYADGLADVASAKGWSADEIRTGGWGAASWPSLRLLAVCVLCDATA
jgi:hypothetical protein